MKRKTQRLFIRKLCSAVEKKCKATKISSIYELPKQNVYYIVNNKLVLRNYENLKNIRKIYDIKILDLKNNIAEWYVIS